MYKRFKKEPRLRREGHKWPVVFPEFTDAEEETRKLIFKRLNQVCVATEGFVLCYNGWDKTKNRLLFDCKHKHNHRGWKESAKRASLKPEQPPRPVRMYETDKEKAERLNRGPVPPKPVVSYEHPCNFAFQLSYKTEEKCWIFLTGTGTPLHSYHMKLKKEDIPKDTRVFDYNKLRRKPSAVSASSSNNNVINPVPLETWQRKDYSSYQTFMPILKEMFDSADRSFRVHEYLQELFERELRIVRHYEAGDPNIRGHEATQKVPAPKVASLPAGDMSQSAKRKSSVTASTSPSKSHKKQRVTTPK